MSAPSISICCNFYAEPHAMPGWLEMAMGGFFDEVYCISSPPAGVKPDEETIELVKKAGVRLIFTSIEAGFGVVRTRCIRESKCDYVFISDADERFHVEAPLVTTEGTEGYPHVKEPNLPVRRHGEIVKQGEMVREMMRQKHDAIRLSRRHWFCAPGEFERPCENWHTRKDWQLRIVANNQFIFYDPHHRMHEKLLLSSSWSEPGFASGDTHRGPFIDHYHCYYKPMESDNNRVDAETYERLDKGVTADMWLNGAAGVQQPVPPTEEPPTTVIPKRAKKREPEPAEGEATAS